MCYYIFRNEFLLINFLLKQTHVMTLYPQKNLYWICVLNLNLRLWHQHELGNYLHIKVHTQTNWSDSKIWLAICESVSNKSLNHKRNNLWVMSWNSTNLWVALCESSSLGVASRISLHIVLSPQMRQSKNNKANIIHVNPFLSMSHFYTPWKRQKIFGFLTFSGGIEMWNWTKMG